MDIALERSYPTPFANVSLLPVLLFSLMQQKNSPRTAMAIKKEYDFIIVGAGSAGSVLANRLSEMPCTSVLLLEAGPPPPLLTEIPATERLFWNTDIDWNFKTVSQKHTGAGLKNRRIVWPSGKTLGGSSVLNDGIYNRGNRKNYDDWADDGAEGWSYEEVLPYFKKLEENMDPEYISNGYHGTEGEATIHRPRYRSEYKGALFKTIRKLGYKVVDPNAHRQTGFYDHQGTLRNSQMCSTAKAYLVPAENRTNLDILPKAMVRKIVIENSTAVGIQFDFQGKTYVVKSRKEVIVSAGAINTPKLLMLSGIGPRKELKRHRIPIIAELPVGENLQDHVGSNLNFLLKQDIPEVHEKLVSPLNIAQYIQNRTGPLASTQFVTALGFLKNEGNPHGEFPDYKLYFAESSATLFPLLNLGMKQEVFKKLYGPYIGRPFYTCFAHLLQPRSRGEITLASADPYDNPIIDPNYFDDPDDVKDIIEGLKTCAKIGTSKAMRKIGSEPFTTLYPGCEKFYGNDDLYYWCQINSVAISFFHPVGTAKMGHPHDPTTVVDPQLRVKGIEGLRVVDASVMPIIPSGDINIPVIMVAEKASDMIKSTINCHWTNSEENAIDGDNQNHDKYVDQPEYYGFPYNHWEKANDDNVDSTYIWSEEPLKGVPEQNNWNNGEYSKSKMNKEYTHEWNNESPPKKLINDDVHNLRNKKEGHERITSSIKSSLKSPIPHQPPQIYSSDENQTSLLHFSYQKEHSLPYSADEKLHSLNAEKSFQEHSLDKEHNPITDYPSKEQQSFPHPLDENHKFSVTNQKQNLITMYPDQEQQSSLHSSDREQDFSSNDYEDQDQNLLIVYLDQEKQSPPIFSDEKHYIFSKDYSNQEQHSLPIPFDQEENLLTVPLHQNKESSNFSIHEQPFLLHSFEPEQQSFPYSSEREQYVPIHPTELEKQFESYSVDGGFKTLSQHYAANKKPPLPCAKKGFARLFSRRISSPKKLEEKNDSLKQSTLDSVKLSVENSSEKPKIDFSKNQDKSFSTIYSSYDIKVPIKRKSNR